MEMKSEDLIDIINACGKNGVNCIKIGDINIEFNGFVKVLESDYSSIVDPVDKEVLTDPNFQHQQDLESGLEDDEELMILDPAGWEDKLMKNELEESITNIEG